MAEDFPSRHVCGCKLTRVFEPPAVHYHSPGFFSSDVSHFQKQLGPDRYARFEAQRDAAQARAKAGTLTPYEQQLENA